MSERKSAEIKFRCTPTFKATVQAAAQAADLTMSEYIERAVEEKEWTAANQKLDGTSLVGNAIRDVADIPELDVEESQFSTILVKTQVGRCASCGEAKEWEAACSICGVTLNGNAPPFGDAGKKVCTGGCKPWEFCRCKATA